MRLPADDETAATTVRRTRRAGRGKPEILDAAAEVIAARGADATRFADVSEASGVPVGTLQYYFGNRDDLLHAAFRHIAGQEIEAMEDVLRVDADPWDQLRRLLVAVIPEGDHAEGVWRTWVEYWRAGIRDEELREGANAMYRQWHSLVEQVLRAGIASGRLRNDIDPGTAAIQIAALVDGIAVPIVLGDETVSRARNPSRIVIDAVERLLDVTSGPTAG